jgi:hypothetical protein
MVIMLKFKVIFERLLTSSFRIECKISDFFLKNRSRRSAKSKLVLKLDRSVSGFNKCFKALHSKWFIELPTCLVIASSSK